MRRKVKHRMSRPMDISVYKGRDEGGTERKLQREGLREREREAERETQFGMKRTNSASIVRVAWLTF